jgi:hypothetical protein
MVNAIASAHSQGQHGTTTQPHITRPTPHTPTLVQHASVPLPSSSLHSAARRPFSPATTIFRLYLDFITLYLRHSCSDADEEPTVVINMRHRTYTCNSVLAAGFIVMLQRRLGDFPVFSLIFPLTHLLTTPSILHRSQ